jgi:hypothetical protein
MRYKSGYAFWIARKGRVISTVQPGAKCIGKQEQFVPTPRGLHII